LPGQSTEVELKQQLARSLHARCNQASLRARTAGLPTSANRLRLGISNLAACYCDVRTERFDRDRAILVGAGLGGPGGKSSRALLSVACATPGRLNPKYLNPTPELQSMNRTAEEIRSWLSRARGERDEPSSRRKLEAVGPSRKRSNSELPRCLPPLSTPALGRSLTQTPS